VKLKSYHALLLAVFVCITLVLPACSDVEAGFNEVCINLGDEPPTLDPQLVYDVVPMRVINAVFEGLCRKDKEGLPVPGAAERWEISEDKLTYTFYIRKDAKWSNGTPVTAKDFKDAWMRALDPEPQYHEPAFMANLFFCIKGAEAYAYGEGKAEDVAVDVVDDRTLRVTLVQPTPYFLDLVCNSVYMPVNKEFYDKQISGDISNYGTEAEAILGNGPFTVQEWNHDENIVLVKNDTYWNADVINLEKIDFKMIRDNTAAINSFKSGEIDMIEITDRMLAAELENSNCRVEAYNSGIVEYVTLNNEDPVLCNVNIRKALSYALDRKTLVEKILNDGSKEAYGFVSPIVAGYNGKFRQQAGDLFKDNDIDTARKLLEKGLDELGISEMPKIVFLVNDTELSKRDAQVLKDMWKKSLDVDVELQVMSFDAMAEKMMSKDYQMALLTWSADYNDPLAYLDVFSSKSFYNVAFYSNNQFEELLDRAIREIDDKSRMELLIKAEQIAMDDMAVCPLYFIANSYAVNNRVKGLVRGSSAIQDIDMYWTYVE